MRRHQEALWAVLSHCNVVFGESQTDDFNNQWLGLYIYRPAQIGSFDVQAWWQPQKDKLEALVKRAASDAFPDITINPEFGWIMPVPDELADFVAKNTGRPMPGRFNSNLVRYVERDSVVWLTPPEAALYDYLKAADWTFVPQPAVVMGDGGWLSPDFLIYWGGRATQAIMVEVDSDQFHGLPSRREKDEHKERYLQSLGFEYLRFNAKSCLKEPQEVIAEIKAFCVRKYGPAK